MLVSSASVTPATAPKKHACGWSNVTIYARDVRAVVCAFPSSLLWPLLLLILLCGVGTWAVTKAAIVSSNNAKDIALSRAKDAAADYSRLVSATFSLTQVLESLVLHDPQYSAASGLFNISAPALKAADPCACLLGLELAPSGVIRDQYPPGNDPLIGMDLFADARSAAPALAAVSDPDISVEGPLPPLTDSNDSGNSVGSLLVVRKAIHLPVTDPGEDWGRPDEPNPVCGAPCEYNATSGTKFWGLVIVAVELEALKAFVTTTATGDASGSDSGMSAPLRTLAKFGYRYTLMAPAPAGYGAAAEGESNGALIVPSEMLEVESSPGGAGSHALPMTVELGYEAEWTLLVGPSGSSWTPSWYGGVVALVVIVSVGAAVLLFGLLVSRRRSHMLLQALLPKDLIQGLQSGDLQAPLEAKPRRNWESPADVLMELLNLLLSGLQPDMRDVVLLTTVLRRRRLDVYRPFNLQARLREAHLATDVESALMRQLGTHGDIRFHSVASSSVSRPLSPSGGGDNSARSGSGSEDADGRGGGTRWRSSAAGLALEGQQLMQQRGQPELDCHTLHGALEYILGGEVDGDLGVFAIETHTAADGEEDDIERPPVSTTHRLGKKDDRRGISSQCASLAKEGDPTALERTDGRSIPHPSPPAPLPSAVCRQSADERTDAAGSVAGCPTATVAATGYNMPEAGAVVVAKELPALARRSLVGSVGAILGAVLSQRQLTAPPMSVSCSGPRAPHYADRGCPQHPDLVGPSPPQSFSVLRTTAFRGDEEKDAVRAETSVQLADTQFLLSRGTLALAAALEDGRTETPPAVPANTAATIAAAGIGDQPYAVGALGNARSPLVKRSPRGASQVVLPPQCQNPRGLPLTLTRPEAASSTRTQSRRSSIDGPIGSSQWQHGCASRAGLAGPAPAMLSSPAANAMATPDGSRHKYDHCESRFAATTARPSGSRHSADLESEGAEPAAAQVRVVPPTFPGRAAAAVAVPLPLVEEVERLLSCADNWQFDIWALQEASCGHSLSSLGFFLVQRAGLVEGLRLDPVRLARLFRTLESGYPASNPYHNSAHAANVLHTLHVLLHGTRLTVHYLDAVGLLAAYFAAAVHDYGHPGLTNDFLVATSHPLALRYNDRSPLESHHAAAFFSLLAERPDMDITAVLNREQRAAFRKLVVDMVLATDMKQHFAILNQFNTVHGLSGHYASSGTSAAAAAAARTATGNSASPHCGSTLGRSPAAAEYVTAGRRLGPPAALPVMMTSESINPPTPLNDAERTLSLQVMLKAADIGHLGAGLEGHTRSAFMSSWRFLWSGRRQRPFLESDRCWNVSGQTTTTGSSKRR